ncbi:hypothetical protein SLS62_001430 [Diatrype stigma]|uniref:Uncharacterized protein n=1 Tax=Diatrype stigma TaxID=117547 RepID=A0AAN9VAK6_9PEZI
MMDQFPPSSPRTPPPPSSSPRPAAATANRRQFGLQDEIKGSDEDDDSDGSLASLSAIIGQRNHNAVSTPQVKRVASSSTAIGARRGSPLTLQQKQQQAHKFDLKALISHTRQSERDDETSKQAEELIKKVEDSDSSTGGISDDGDDDNDGDSSDNVDEDEMMATSPSRGIKKKKKNKKPKTKDLQQVAKELLDDGGGGGGSGDNGGSGRDEDENPKGDKIVRAINRAAGQGAGSGGRRRRCYFFDVDLPPLFQPAKTPFPADAVEARRQGGGGGGPWRFLADPQTRDQAIIHGLPHTIVARGRELPPELFVWVLDQVCVERDPRLRAQYCSLAAACRDRTRELVDGARLYGALERIGGPKYARAAAVTMRPLKSTPEVEDPYRGRDWSGLAAFLDLLRQMAPNLNPNLDPGGGSVVVEAIQLLLRMSLDPVVVAAVRREHLAALGALVAALPAGAEATRRRALSWNDACFSICSYVLKCTDDTIQRLDPIISIPKSSAKLADLRRRLAATILFNDDETFGRHPTDSALEGEGHDALLDRLEQPDFTIRPATDYEELRALVALLDIVVESGGFLRRRRRRRKHGDGDAGGGAREERDAADGDRQFDADVDALTFRLRVLHDKIHDNGLLARKEAKTTIDVVSKRLTYAVRTRPPPKTSIFDPQPPDREEADLPRQRDFMKNWAQRKAAANGGGAERRSPAAAV